MILGATALVTVALVETASAALTKVSLQVRSSGSGTTVTVAASKDEDATASLAVYAPPGSVLKLDQAPGTVVGKVRSNFVALFLGSAAFPLVGDIQVAAAGSVPTGVQEACTQGQPVAATWLLSLVAAGRRFDLPLYVSPTAPEEAAIGPAKLLVCFAPSDLQPQAQCEPTFCTKFVGASFTFTGVFSRLRTATWVGVWTPYAPATGQRNAAGRVATPTAVAPGRITLVASRTARRTVRLRGLLTQNELPTTGEVQVLAGPRPGRLERVKTLRVAADGRVAFTYRGPATFFRLRGAASVRAAPPLCTSFAALAVPCVNPRQSGFSVRSGLKHRPN